MIKTLQQALQMDREKFKVPRSVQQAIPVQRIWPDGVFQSEMCIRDRSDNWIVQNLNSALNTWNEKLAEIWTLSLIHI